MYNDLMSYLSALIKNIPVEDLPKKESPKSEPEMKVEDKSVEVKNVDEKLLKNKNSLRRKKPSKRQERKPKDKNFLKVLGQVQDSFLLSTFPNKEKTDEIENNKMYMKNWSTSVYIDVSEEIKKSYGEKEYTFSKKKILESRYFQNMVRETYTTRFGDVNLKFYSNRNDPNYFVIRVIG